MFQSFEDIQDPTRGASRIAALRDELARQELDGFVVPRADEHQGEYVAGYAERLFWLTGFSGSAGLAVVLDRAAAVFVDGRYTLQVREQVDTAVFEPRHVTEEPVSKWLRANAAPGARIGFDPWLHTPDQVRKLRTACAAAGAELVATDGNPVDSIWQDQPLPPAGAVTIHSLQFAGDAAAEKLDEIQNDLKEAGEDAVVLTLPDSIAWLFNIRGHDIPHVPVALAFAIVPASGRPALHIDPAKLHDAERAYLDTLADLREPEAFEEDLRSIAQDGWRIRIDPATAAYQIRRILESAGCTVTSGADPCVLRKARKNPFEIAGSHAAHKRDGVALARFLAWFEKEAPKGRLDEIGVAKELELFRTETGKLKDVAFPSISGAGPNSALPHYRVSYKTSRKLAPGSLYLIDSGAQYLDGTTDITRTLAVGEPSSEMRERFTRVLKGHIAIATARFPVGTTGGQIDILARLPLWEVGLDFDHGTGHGVGSYLSVHEGPQRISKSAFGVPLEPGMIISNEPGYYKEGEYGIRIENLVLVRAEDEPAKGGIAMLGFETLTLAPIDLTLVDTSLMTGAEVDWLNTYHARVLEEVGPRLKEPDREWLANATRAVKKRR